MEENNSISKVDVDGNEESPSPTDLWTYAFNDKTATRHKSRLGRRRLIYQGVKKDTIDRTPKSKCDSNPLRVTQSNPFRDSYSNTPLMTHPVSNFSSRWPNENGHNKSQDKSFISLFERNIDFQPFQNNVLKEIGNVPNSNGLDSSKSFLNTGKENKDNGKDSIKSILNNSFILNEPEQCAPCDVSKGSDEQPAFLSMFRNNTLGDSSSSDIGNNSSFLTAHDINPIECSASQDSFYLKTPGKRLATLLPTSNSPFDPLAGIIDDDDNFYTKDSGSVKNELNKSQQRHANNADSTFPKPEPPNESMTSRTPQTEFKVPYQPISYACFNSSLFSTNKILSEEKKHPKSASEFGRPEISENPFIDSINRNPIKENPGENASLPLPKVLNSMKHEQYGPSKPGNVGSNISPLISVIDKSTDAVNSADKSTDAVNSADKSTDSVKSNNSIENKSVDSEGSNFCMSDLKDALPRQSTGLWSKSSFDFLKKPEANPATKETKIEVSRWKDFFNTNEVKPKPVAVSEPNDVTVVAANSKVNLFTSKPATSLFGNDVGKNIQTSTPSFPSVSNSDMFKPPNPIYPFIPLNQPSSLFPSTMQSVAPAPSTHMCYVNKIPYKLLTILGKGGSSQVYMGLDREQQLVAIKCVNLANVDDVIANGYLNEIKVLESLQGCPTVIRMFQHEFVTQTKMLYVVMEIGEIDFSKLLKDINATNKISISMINYYWTEMVSAVKDIHEKGIIHSDLKPANFLIVKGRLKLIDFGISSSIQGDMTSVLKEVTTGTYNYMSPEAITYSKDLAGYKINFKSDIWSLGCILYNLLYGQTPFSSYRNTWSKLQAIADPNCKVVYPEQPAIPFHLKVALRSCLIKDPRVRPTTSELLQFLDLSLSFSSLEYQLKQFNGLDVQQNLPPLNEMIRYLSAFQVRKNNTRN